MPAVKVEWKINIIGTAAMLVTILVAGTAFYSQVIQNTQALARGETRLTAQTTVVENVKERTSILETKLNFLIDQNKQVISLLKGR